MGSAPSATVQTKRSAPKPKAILKVQPEQPKPEIIKVISKQIEMPRGLTEEMTSELKSIENSNLLLFENRFLLKVAKGQIKILLKNKQSSLIKETFSSIHHDQAIIKLQKASSYDLHIYRQIFIIKMKCFLSQILKDDSQYQSAGQFTKLKQKLNSQFQNIITELLGQISGKSCIWHSLHLTQKQMVTNIINFLHEEGIDSSVFDTLQPQLYI